MDGVSGTGRLNRLASVPGTGTKVPVVIAAVGLVLTAALFIWLLRDAERDAARQLETQLTSVIESSEAALDQVAEKLVSLSGLFRASVVVTPVEFKRFTGDIGLAPGMSGIGYLARVGHDGIDAIETVLTRAHGQPIQVFQFDDGGEPEPLTPRPEHYPVVHAHPSEEWLPLIGYDAGSDPRAATTLVEALQTGQIAVTPFFEFYPGSEGDDVAMLMPVSDPAGGEAHALVAAMIDFSDLIEANVPAGVAPHVSIEFHEGAIPYQGPGRHAVFDYDGRQWTIAITALPGSPFAVDAGGAYTVLAIGLLATALAFLLTVVTGQRMRAATELAVARHANDAKDRFIASVSHELRTPLTAVLGFAEILKGEDDLSTEEGMAMMKAITEEATDLAHIIDDLLVAARGEIGQLSIAQTAVSLRIEVEGVVAASGINRVTVWPPEGGNESVLGDPTRVRQILRNLLENASRYGGESIQIRIQPAGSEVRVEVRDDGAGVPDEIQGRLFEPYERFGGALGVTESLGLGLSVSAQLAELMNGRLEHVRREGWTLFTLTLPAATLIQDRRVSRSVSSR